MLAASTSAFQAERASSNLVSCSRETLPLARAKVLVNETVGSKQYLLEEGLDIAGDGREDNMNIDNETLIKYFNQNEKQYKVALKVLSQLDGMSTSEIFDFMENLKHFIKKVPLKFNL